MHDMNIMWIPWVVIAAVSGLVWAVGYTLKASGDHPIAPRLLSVGAILFWICIAGAVITWWLGEARWEEQMNRY